MKEIKAPNLLERGYKNLYLAGSIEMGTAEKWQDKIISALENYNLIIFNPRRDDWDNSWIQSIDDKKFREQVEWELSSMEMSDIIALYFDPKTKSPISLLELGLFSKTGKLIVCCPNGFWRKGNVDIVCDRYRIELVDNMLELINKIKKYI